MKTSVVSENSRSTWDSCWVRPAKASGRFKNSSKPQMRPRKRNSNSPELLTEDKLSNFTQPILEQVVQELPDSAEAHVDRSELFSVCILPRGTIASERF